MRYVVYDIVSGEILRVCTATSREGAQLEQNETDGVLECGPEVSDLTHQVVKGACVPRSSE